MRRSAIAALLLFPLSSYGATRRDAAGRDDAGAGTGKALVSVLPAPQVVRGDGRAVAVARRGGAITFRAGPGTGVDRGRALFALRLKQAAGVTLRPAASDGPDAVVVTLVPPDAFAGALGSGTSGRLTSGQLRQAYRLQVAAGSGRATVRVEACSPLGAYYGLVTLCQLVEPRDDSVTAPSVTIIDWPAVSFRLVKSSATFAPRERLEETARVAPAMKFNFFGLQYHQGTREKGRRGLNHKGNWATHSSRNPQPHFKENVASICRRARREGLLGAIVYFSPFRGKDYFRLDREGDRAAYLAFLEWCMEQGAAGVEIDYNDWCLTGKWRGHGAEWPMEKVVSFVHRHLRKRHPDAHVLWCPPIRARGADGKQFGYRGAVTPGYAAVLKQIPAGVKVIWTGPMGPPGKTATIVKKLPVETIRAWAKAAGRKPLLWFNGPTAEHCEGDKAVRIFAGNLLPKDLGKHVTGAHLNGAPTLGMQPYALMAADFFWNPTAWSVEGSLSRARRFAAVMRPLLVD